MEEAEIPQGHDLRHTFDRIPSRATSPSRTTPIGGTKYDQRRERLRKRQVTLKTFTKDLPELKWKQAPWGVQKERQKVFGELLRLQYKVGLVSTRGLLPNLPREVTASQSQRRNSLQR
ncbi:hypothetical protein BDDG_08015 [Blastomyces dermatitidis ATCC 18188]|uniref:Uncharacterized protein n=1 Tax=Ajellomyces dermatitidis (strain ATCC 18188 / CBS 674.68) TaxID=653446 RepID=F2TPA7_AJEDA|nr:hypothetical protein BDDG_08015 [Blastomyces dermatitidis ATCC 18188]